MYKRILLPLDGSALAETALPYAVAQAQRFKAELILLRVLEPFSGNPGPMSTGVIIAQERAREIDRLYLEGVADRIREDGVAVRVEVISGRPYHEITRYAQTNDVDLIVVCARGCSGISRWLIGSVADRVVRGADVPVLLVRAEEEEKVLGNGPAPGVRITRSR
jgi:nucleotide-binding universal stress UspA family protein